MKLVGPNEGATGTSPPDEIMELITCRLLNFLFIPKWGLGGAAVASGITMALWNVTLVILDRRVVQLDPSVLCLLNKKGPS